MFLHRHSVLALFFVSAMLSSCLNDEDMVGITPIAYVSFYHGTTQAEELAISVDNKAYPRDYSPFAYGTYIDYGNFFTGSRNFSFSNSTRTSSLLDTLITLKASQTYSVFLADEANSFVPIIVEDHLSNSGEGKALLRLVHLSPVTAAVTLLANNGSTPLFGPMDFKEVTDYKVMNSGPVVLKVNEVQSGQTLVASEEVTLHPGRIYTVIIKGGQSISTSTEELDIQIIRNYPNY